jgi:DNA-binding NarL/FixJ family response regulator
VLLESALKRAPRGDARADILFRLGFLQQLMGDWPAAEELAAQALEEIEDDVRLTIDIKLLLGGVSHITGRNWDAGARHVADAMRLAEELGDPRVLAGTIGHFATWQYETGHGYSPELERRARELEPWTAHLRTMDHPDFDFSFIKAQEGDRLGADALQERLLERAEHNGDYSSITFLLADRVGSDLAAGRPDVAADRLDHAERLARTTGQRTALAHVLTWRTGLLARLGRAEDAWRIGRETLQLIAETGFAGGEPAVRIELAMLELSRRNPAAAHEILQPSVPPADHSDPRPWGWQAPTDVEALVGMGRLEEARLILDGINQDRRTGWFATTMVDAQRAAALLSAAEGDLSNATRLAEAAYATYVARDDRWEQARTQLIAGEIHRRARRRAKARSALADAIAIFDSLGAAAWATQAREQLERIGAGREDARGGLTPTQQEVAKLVVGGLTNRQVADRLFMSVHTVEAHLSAIYRTLDIRSRGELGPAMERPAAQSIRDTRPSVRDSAPVPESET